MKTDFIKCGSTAEGLTLRKVGPRSWCLIYGNAIATAEECHYRRFYERQPYAFELTDDLTELVNRQTAERILSGGTWQGMPLWLSHEQQLTITALAEAVRCRPEDTLPVTLKIGEQEGNPVMHTFTTSDEVQSLAAAVATHIARCLADGYAEKATLPALVNDLLKE